MTSMADVSREVRVRCMCGKTLIAPESARGKSAPCPKCGYELYVPLQGEDHEAIHRDQLSRGMLFSVAGGMLGAGVWLLVYWGTGREYRVVAMLVGLLCGIGMIIGTSRRGMEVGLYSGMIAFGSIMAAQWVLYTVALPTMIERDVRSFLDDPWSRANIVAVILENGIDHAPVSKEEARLTALSMEPQEQRDLIHRHEAVLGRVLERDARDEIRRQGFFATMFPGRTVYYTFVAILTAGFMGVFGRENPTAGD